MLRSLNPLLPTTFCGPTMANQAPTRRVAGAVLFRVWQGAPHFRRNFDGRRWAGALVLAMRQLFFVVLMACGLAHAAQAQAPMPPTAPPDGLTRKERRELARRVAADARRPKVVLSDRDRELSEALFVDGVKYVLLEDYTKALERLLKAYALSPDNAAVSFKIAEANLLSGNLRDATNYAEAAVRLDPANADRKSVV